MRALFHHAGAAWSGEARAFVAAARGLAAQGWQTVVATDGGGEVHRRAEALGVAVATLDAADGVLGGTAALARAVRAHIAEVLFVHGDRGQVLGAGAAWRASRGAVVRRFGVGAPPEVGRAARAALRTAPTGFLCTTPEQAAPLAALAAAFPPIVADLGVAVPGAPADAAAPEPGGGEPARRRDVGFRRIVCLYEPGARLRAAVVLRAAAMLAPRHPELRLTLVGPGADDEGLRMHAAALGVNRIVAHRGGGEDAAPRLARADIGWVIADGDDGAFGALDCMAARVPALVERGSVAARYIADGIAGAHVTAGDVAGTAAVVAELLARDADRQAMGAAGEARVARLHTEAAMLDGFARAATAARDRTRWRA
jgi:hypothetical protein